MEASRLEQKKICPRFERALTILNHRWNTLLIYQLLEGPKRFSAIINQLGISSRVLTERLKELELEGIVERKVFPETPVRIEYSLTQKGFALEAIIRGIEEWSQEWIELEE